MLAYRLAFVLDRLMENLPPALPVVCCLACRLSVLEARALICQKSYIGCCGHMARCRICCCGRVMLQAWWVVWARTARESRCLL